MISPSMGTVTLPVYEGFTKLLVWPKPHAVSKQILTISWQRVVILLGQKLLWSDVQGNNPLSNQVW